MMTSTVALSSYPFIRSVFSKFDQKKFKIISHPDGNEFLAIKRLQIWMDQIKMPIDVAFEIGKVYMNSMEQWRLFCIGAPSLKERKLHLFSDHLTEALAKEMLRRLSVEPSKQEGEMVCTKQLLEYVLKEVFNDLPVEEKIACLRRLKGFEMPQKIRDAFEKAGKDPNPVEKLKILEQVQLELNSYQGLWDWASLNLQFFSWKVQIAVAASFQHALFQVCIRWAVIACLAVLASVSHYYFHEVHKGLIAVSLLGAIVCAIGLFILIDRVFDTAATHWILISGVYWTVLLVCSPKNFLEKALNENFAQVLLDQVARSINESIPKQLEQYANAQLPALVAVWQQLVLENS